MLSHFYNLRLIHLTIFVHLLSINIMKSNLAIALICMLTACSQKPTTENELIKPKKIAQANWLVGTWFSESGERSNYETLEQIQRLNLCGKELLDSAW